jgi:periplasmic protein CpxP/Spy
MKSHLIAAATAALLGAALLPSPAALAQTAPAKAHPAAHAAAAKPGEGQMLARVEQRIAELHSRLHITAAEEAQWRPFAQEMLANARKIDQKVMERAETYQTMNAVDNMRSYAAIAAQHAENTQQLVPVFETLYAALSTAQKHEADRLWRGFAAAHEKRHAKK